MLIRTILISFCLCNLYGFIGIDFNIGKVYTLIPIINLVLALIIIISLISGYLISKLVVI